MEDQNRSERVDRRTVLKVAGATAAVTMVAGCGGGGGDGGDGGDDGGGDNGGGGGGNGGGGEPIESGTEIELGGEVQAWQGQGPDQIADQENPTLTLQEGESYDITWENLDGQGHNLEIVDDNDEVVDDYSTDQMAEEGETQTLSIDEVTSEMTEYVCRPHQGTMRGPIEVQ